jgi:molecular chaperone GrpE (heat shock protein)
MSGPVNHLKFAVLFAVAACVFTGCASKDDVSPMEVETQAFEDLRSEIRAVIDDPTREKEAIAMLDALAQDLETLRVSVSERRQQFKELNANYDATRAEFEAFFDQVNRQIQSNKRQASEKNRALFAIITPDERSAISKVHTKAMNAAIRNMQSI